MCLTVLPPFDCIYPGLRYAISVHISSWSWSKSLELIQLDSQKAALDVIRQAFTYEVNICNGDFFLNMLKEKPFQTLLDSLVPSFSLEPEVMKLSGFLFWYSITWVSKPLHYIRSILCACSCSYQISHLCRIWEGILASAVSAPGLAMLRLLVHITGCWSACHLHERLAWKILSCYLYVWISVLMLCNSLSIFPHKYFSNFSSTLISLEDLSFTGCTCEQNALIHDTAFKVLNDWNKNFLLKAPYLLLIVLVCCVFFPVK